MRAFSLALPRVSPLAARPDKRFSIVWFAVFLFRLIVVTGKQIALAKRLFSRKVRIALRSVTFTPTYRRSLISPLQGIINALLNGQLVPRLSSGVGLVPKIKTHRLGAFLFLEQVTRVELAGNSLGSCRHTARRHLHYNNNYIPFFLPCQCFFLSF